MQAPVWCSAIVRARTSCVCVCVCYITVAFGYVFASVVKYWGLVAIRSLIVPFVSVECACINLQIAQCLFSLLCCCVTNPAASHGITAYRLASFPLKLLFKFLTQPSVWTIAVTDGGLFFFLMQAVGALILVSHLSRTKETSWLWKRSRF